MSTIKADTIQSSSGGAVNLTDLYPARAWGNFSNVGGPSLRRSDNVSSLTDAATNTTDVNFTNACLLYTSDAADE